MTKQRQYKRLLKETIEQVKHDQLQTTEEVYDKLIFELENLTYYKPKKDKVRQG